MTPDSFLPPLIGLGPHYHSCPPLHCQLNTFDALGRKVVVAVEFIECTPAHRAGFQQR